MTSYIATTSNLHSLLHTGNRDRKTTSFCVSSSLHSICLTRNNSQRFNSKLLCSPLTFNPVRYSIKSGESVVGKRRCGVVCNAGEPSQLVMSSGSPPRGGSRIRVTRGSAPVSTISSAILLMAKGNSSQKSLIVPLLALQAPTSVISWVKSEYGFWTAFLALLVRLFFFIPGELELPFMALLLVIVAPNQVLNIRETKEGAIIASVIAAYLAYQHFSRVGSLEKAFDQGSIVSTLATICIAAVSCFFLIVT